jgi:hypothetical protein
MKAPPIARLTVTLPDDLLKGIDRLERNRSRFVTEAVRNELQRRRRAELQRSLGNPHPESLELADQGIEDWFGGLPEEDVEGLVDMNAGKAIRWVPGEGWTEVSE